MPANSDLDPNSQITDATRWNLLERKRSEVGARKAFDLFRRNGIEPLLIKGVAALQYYPVAVRRFSIDTDLAVSKTDFTAARKISQGPAATGLAIDLHCGLRHLDTVPWDDLFEHSQLIDLDGGTVRVLCREDHLRVLCVHWLTDGGIHKDRLWDIYYGVEDRPADFDWDRFLNIVSPRRRRWLVCTLGLAHRYLGLDLADTPVEAEAQDLPQWLTRVIEKEWASETKPRPLETTVLHPGIFVAEMKKRLRPNPIWATVQSEGSFDAPTRIHYQIKNFFRRILPSFRRVSTTLKEAAR